MQNHKEEIEKQYINTTYKQTIYKLHPKTKIAIRTLYSISLSLSKI